jgi:magnesium chelatase subunit H
MRQRRISAADATPLRVVILTLDSHMASAVERAQHTLLAEMPGLRLSLHAAAEWDDDPAALQRCRDDIAEGDIIITSMMFMEDHIQAVLPALQARRDHCDAMVACLSAAEVVRLTRLGRFDMSATPGGPMALLKRLRGKSNGKATSGEQQMRMLRRIPKILRFIPGPAQDVRAYFLTMQYLFAGSDDNMASLVRFLVDRYAAGPRSALRGQVKAALPADYPDLGLYHPRLKGRIADRAEALPVPHAPQRGTVGLLVMRSYILAGNTGHYDGVIAALEARGLRVIPAFATGLDARPAIERFFMRDGQATVDAVVSLTGFSLVGGPAYNDARAAEEMLAALDVPYLATLSVEFQSLEQWQASERGLMPVEATIMVAIPELDGSTGPMVFGGRSSENDGSSRDMHVHGERADTLAARVDRLVSLRRTPRDQRKVAIVLFNFPPNAGNTGTAAYLSVFASLHRTLAALRDDGYDVEVPATVDELRERIIDGNARQLGAHANVHARIPVDDHLRRERWLAEIEQHWGPAPGRQQLAVRARRTVRQGAGRRAALLRLGRRPDATAVRQGVHADSRVFSLLPLPARGLWRQRRAALRHAWGARIHAGQAGRAVRGLLAGPADRRPAEHLSVRLQQPFGRDNRQAARGRHPGQLPDPAGRCGRAVQGPRRPQGVDRALARPAPAGARRARRGGHDRPGTGRRSRPGRSRAGLAG